MIDNHRAHLDLAFPRSAKARSCCKIRHTHVIDWEPMVAKPKTFDHISRMQRLFREAHQHSGADALERLQILLEVAENARLTGAAQPPFDQPPESWRALALGSLGADRRGELRLRPAFGR